MDGLRGPVGSSSGMLSFTPPRHRDVASVESVAVLPLLAYGGQRPVVALGSCSVGSSKQVHLQLANETELERVVTLDKLPACVSVSDDATGVPVAVGDSLTVQRKCSVTLRIGWAPAAAGSLCESIRWTMMEGSRQVRLEARLQGTAADAPKAGRAGAAKPPTSTATTATGVRTAAAAAKPGQPAPAGKPGAAATAAPKAAPRGGLTLGRPQPVAAGAGVPRTSGSLEPAAVNAALAAAANIRLPPTPVQAGSSPSLANGQRGNGGLKLHTPPHRNASPPVRGVALADGGKALDFRRVGAAESKRERGLIAWMNSEVAPHEAASADAGAGAGGLPGASVRRLLGEVCGKAYRLFKRDEGFAVLGEKLEAKIAARQLAIKDVENTLMDTRMRQQAMEVLTSYHPFWLAVGLQTVLGKALTLSHGNMLSLMRPGEAPAFLRAFIAEHLLADAELAARFRGTAFKADFWEALGALVLGRSLLLLLLLDRMATSSSLPPGTPSLFRGDAAVKSSEQALQELLQPRLAGAGDVRHTLRSFGYALEYVQHARDEADYRVAKPTDLRDGTRLAKLLDNLRKQYQSGLPGSAAPTPPLSAQPSSVSVASTSQSGLAARLGVACAGRLPSAQEDLLPSMAFPQHTGRPLDEAAMRNNNIRLCRGLQLHGVNIQGLAAGSASGPRDTSADGVAKAVAEGLIRVDQRVTLGVLWQLAMRFKLRKHVDVKTLEREATRLRRAAAAAASSAGLDPASASPSGPDTEEDDAALLRYFNDPVSQALLGWLRAACALHGVSVSNFTWALADGRALCYLVHTYLPDALPLSRISTPELPASADEMARLTGGNEYVKLETLKSNGWAAVYEMGGAIQDDEAAAAYKRSVAANFAAVHAAGEALGVPAMLSAEDYLEDGPDELAAILYVSLLSEALMKLSAERRAGYVIMDFLRRRLCWRPSYMRACLERYKANVRKQEAACAIQAHWRMVLDRRRFLRLRRAACVLQALTRKRMASQRSRQRRAAAVALQSAWRAYAARQQLQRARRAACVLQAACRGWATRRELARHAAAATTIQAAWRGYVTRKVHSRDKLVAAQHAAATAIQAAWRGHRERTRFVAARALVVALQANVRQRQSRNSFLAKRQAAIVIQAAWRAHQARDRYQQLRQAAILIQAAWRGKAAARRFAATRQRVLLIQACARGYLARQAVAKRLENIHRIQAAWRGVLDRRLVASVRAQRYAAEQHRAASVLQAVVRGHLARRRLAQMHSAATALQAAWRMISARRQLQGARHAAVVLQSSFRGWRVRQELQQKHQAVTVMQSLWRRRQAVRSLQAAQLAATAIQAAWRCHTAQQAFVRQRAAAVALQAAWRGHATRTRFLQLRAAAITLQAAWRGREFRKEQQQRQAAATALQTAWRARVARLRFQRTRAAAVLIQASVRGMLARRSVQEQRAAATTLQAAWRGYVVRKEQQRRNRAAVLVQAAARMWADRRRFLALLKAAVVLQAGARGAAARRSYARVCVAATAVQGMWRTRQARRELAKRADAYYADLQRQQAELVAAVCQEYINKIRAAMKLQSFWRGYVARKAFAPVWAEHRRNAAKRQAAIVIQAAWRGYQARQAHARVVQALDVFGLLLVPLWRARRERRALHCEYATQHQAAVTIQAYMRMWLERRQLLAATKACVRIQAAWRGYSVRARDGRAKREARRRLEVAAAEAQKAPHRHIGNRAREALELLLRSSKNMVQVVSAIEVIDTATRYSRDCCRLIARSGGVAALLRFMRSLNRSRPHIEVLNRTLAVLANICRYDELIPDVFHSDDCLAVLSERLQFFRDTEEVFAPTVALLQRLVAPRELAAQVPAQVLRHWEGIHQVLFRKADMERKYLERLEGQKGSDVSARESARKLLVVQQQVVSMEALLAATGCSTRANADAGPAAAGGPDNAAQHDQDRDRERDVRERMPGIKNTLVRDVVSKSAVAQPAAVSSVATLKRGSGGGAGASGSPVQAKATLKRM
ncbi:hypothetical protein HYH03_009339 [Edaphochlamys debaryana]|uniref:Calponin-homology (CH) domain-containing protein n=1 Tax=Edaphochlamys debaryana TaxID=47281 RepID=A0A835XY63_9CHLO|nr:hypothetical protein HYH03_009339 [Edaphochlamys debaryana]|eukprot:KAG2492393.1 hypothetical protein HYH03_009339 [Edaphochlamys debaryana]